MQKYPGNLLNVPYSKKVMVPFLFSIFLCVIVHLWFIQYFYYLGEDFKIIMSVGRRRNMIEQYPKNAKFILVWNKYNNNMKAMGIDGLLNCSTSLCVFTDDKNLLYDYKRYDAIVFDESILNSIDRPNRRSKFQFYIFSSLKSSDEMPACELYNDNFFNLTFTYRIDSDVLRSYIAVRNLSGAVVAPKATVMWEKSEKPISSQIKSLLNRKRLAAIWIVNNDKVDESNVLYINRLQEHLFHYSLQIDIYGYPPQLTCPENNCQKMIQDKYYFYIAFENYFSEDYVTDIVLNGYDNYAVPVVFGEANYSKFLPPGSYIDARDFHPYNLAKELFQAINNLTVLEKYFQWTNLYTIHDNSKSRTPLCNLCETVYNYNGNGSSKISMSNFRRWWNGLDGMKRCLSQDHWNERADMIPYHVFNSV